MSDDDVRRALSAYAAATPDLDPRAGLGARMARRQRARQTMIAGTAVLAAAIAGTGVATLDRGDKSTVGVLAVDTPSATPSEELVPTTSPTSVPTPYSTRTGAPPPSDQPTATTAPPATPSPTDPGPVTGSAGGESGLRVVATLAKGGAPTATSVTLTVEAEDDDGQPAMPVIDWGEGEPKGAVSAGGSCVPSDGPDEKDPGSLRESFTHAWRNPGTYTVLVTVVSFDYCDEGVEQERQTVRLPIEIRPGKVVSNGPASPFADHVGHLYGDDEFYRTVTLEWTLRDTDGYVSSVLVDWGDGSEPERFRGSRECDDGDGARYPNTRFADEAAHEYASAGARTVTLTFSSTGCDGEDRQWATETHKVVVD
ncbi:MAG TPA: hypothetical protein VNQ77_07440 [Frankiaceae bacterium]|nr:hypothetical protein [Frankiaceae bacterium]